LVSELREKDGRCSKTSFCIVDAQSVKNTDTAEQKGYDGGKKVSGIKRHIGVDTQGLLHAIHITTANVTDREGALEAFTINQTNLVKVKKILADGGYRGVKFAVIPKRWVVERSFVLLEKCRRLWKNCERKLNTSLQMVVLAFLTIVLKRL
jgi:transposase